MTRLYARSNAEAHLYMDLKACTCGERAFERKSAVITEGATLCSRYTGACPRCGTPRVFVFEIPETIPPVVRHRIEYGGSDPSRVIDAGEWLVVADTHARRRPYTLRDFHVARAATQEILKFLPAGARQIPDDVFWTDRGRAVRDAAPARFTAFRLEIMLRLACDLHDRALARPPGRPAFATALDQRALHGLIEPLTRMVARQDGFAGGELLRQLAAMKEEVDELPIDAHEGGTRVSITGEIAQLADAIAKAGAAPGPATGRPVDPDAGPRRGAELTRLVDELRTVLERLEPTSDGKVAPWYG